MQIEPMFAGQPCSLLMRDYLASEASRNDGRVSDIFKDVNALYSHLKEPAPEARRSMSAAAKAVCKSMPQFANVDRAFANHLQSNQLVMVLPALYLYRNVRANTYVPAGRPEFMSRVTGEKRAGYQPYFFQLFADELNNDIHTKLDAGRRSYRDSDNQLIIWVTQDELRYIERAQAVTVREMLGYPDTFKLADNKPQVSSKEALSIAHQITHQQLLRDIAGVRAPATLKHFLHGASVRLAVIKKSDEVLAGLDGIKLGAVGCGTFAVDLSGEQMMPVIEQAYSAGVFVAAMDARIPLNFPRQETIFDMLFEAIIAGDLNTLSRINRRVLNQV